MPSDPIDILGLVALGVLASLLAAIPAYRERRLLEAAGWMMFGALTAGVLLNDLVHAPGWVVDVFVGLGFALGLSLGWVNFRRRWRGE
jgi:hypothetical protein